MLRNLSIAFLRAGGMLEGREEKTPPGLQRVIGEGHSLFRPNSIVATWHGGDPWAFVASSMMHKNPTLEQLGFFAVEREKAYAVGAKERQREAGKTRGRGQNGKVVAPGPQPISKARELSAQEVGVGARTVSRCKAITEKGCPQLVEATKAGRGLSATGFATANNTMATDSTSRRHWRWRRTRGHFKTLNRSQIGLKIHGAV